MSTIVALEGRYPSWWMTMSCGCERAFCSGTRPKLGRHVWCHVHERKQRDRGHTALLRAYRRDRLSSNWGPWGPVGDQVARLRWLSRQCWLSDDVDEPT